MKRLLLITLLLLAVTVVANATTQDSLPCLSVVDCPPPSVPEPASMMLLGTGLLGLLGLRRKK